MKDGEKNTSKNSPLHSKNFSSLNLQNLNVDTCKTKNITFFHSYI